MKTMNPNRFVIGERVHYYNHVTHKALGMLEVSRIEDGFVFARRFFGGSQEMKFTSEGNATWSSNLCIKHNEH